MTVAIDGKKGERFQKLTFTAGNADERGEFNSFRHGYAGTIYKGQGDTLDQTYLYHSRHWRAASSYVALSRHRDTMRLFVAKEAAADLGQLARQIARQDDRRAASAFHAPMDAAETSRPSTRNSAGGELSDVQNERLQRLLGSMTRNGGPADGRGPAGGGGGRERR